ncbi:MAG: S41 family peptidase [Balneolaceae bacterium]|nr:S41 family peptidase [Balneolaceae bacterium]MDR9446462.1 S41 family peptidase [Balneolaceae bacterium]
MKTFLFPLFGLLLLTVDTNAQSQSDLLLAREPAISHDGAMVSFSYQGDIWTVPFEGGPATRLTIHKAYETAPVWSPDGDHIAFKGSRFGNYDIFTIPSDGGVSERITYYSGSDDLFDWTSQNTLLFASNRTFNQVEWDIELQHVSATGGTPSRLLDALGDHPTMSPNGRFIAFVRGSCRIEREEYDGPADLDVWLYDTETGIYTEVTQNSRNDYLPKWKDDNTLVFISAETGRYNVVMQSIDNEGALIGDMEPITQFETHGVRHFDISEEGHLVLERKANLYTMTSSMEEPSILDIQLSSDYRLDPLESMTFTGDIDQYAVSPNGEYTAMTIRGEIFIKANDEDIRRAVNVSKHSYRDQSPTWVNDSTLVFSSDRDGQYDLYMVTSDDAAKTDLFKTLKFATTRLTSTPEDETNPLVSPNGEKIAFRRDRGGLIVADIDENRGLSNELALLDGWSTPGGVTWSPDNQWIAYALDDLNFNSEVYIHDVKNEMEPVNVSMHPRGDVSPFWSADGSKLGFLSDRNNGDYDLWFAWLQEDEWLKSEEDREDGFYFDTASESDDDLSEQIQIDFNDIHERLWQVTSMPGNEGNLVISNDGETFFFTASSPADRRSDLFSIQFDRDDMKQITKGGQNPGRITLGPNGESLFSVSRGALKQIDPESGSMTSLPFAARMTVDHTLEREQIFEEAWRALSKGFYDPQFHGKDWTALKDTYKPWALAGSTIQDFRYVFNWMLGQLNASHMGLRGSRPEETQEDRTGLLGVAVEPVSQGVRVSHVVPNSPADKAQSKLTVGDIITHVEGHEMKPSTNFFSQLANDVSEQVLLTVVDEDGDSREVVIRPTNSLRDLLYEEWVDSRKELVKEYSNDRLGYIHVEGMNWPSFERFERELMAQGHGKEGIVIDVRWNGGGWTTDMLMTVLNVRQHAYTVPRGATDNLEQNHTSFEHTYPYGERLPLSWWTKPSVAIANQSSYSNAEIFSHAFKTLGHGTLVGMPTFGAVISTGGQGLIDGSYVRMPFRGWYVKGSDMNMENGPAVPDVEIENEPDSKAKGTDPQLKKAVDVLLEEVAVE